MTRRQLLTGWGRATSSAAHVTRPARAHIPPLVTSAGPRGVLARGLGRSYGDASQNAGGLVVDTTAADGPIDLEVESGLVRVGGGVSLDRLVRATLPRGWFPAVVPGTRFVTVGGAVAADVHGKNHHIDGSFAQHVREIVLTTPTGTRRVTPDSDPDLFWATAGGMGLTGIILEAVLQLVPVTTAFIRSTQVRVAKLDALMTAMTENDDRQRYSVAWVDAMAPGGRLGRGVLDVGEHAPIDAVRDLPPGDRLRFAPTSPATAPRWCPPRLLGTATVRAFNAAWYWHAPGRPRTGIVPLHRFFWPLDAVRDWNRLYGPQGFLQYQFVVPFNRADVVPHVLEALRRAGLVVTLAVFKRFGPASPGFLSFPRPGWTLALDLPADQEHLPHVLRRFDDLVADAGGRVYLAKDACLRPEVLPRMYPRLADWQRVRSQVDPEQRMQSDLARRLSLLGRTPDVSSRAVPPTTSTQETST